MDDEAYCPRCRKNIELDLLRDLRRVAAFKANLITMLLIALLLTIGTNWNDLSLEAFVLMISFMLLTPYTLFLAFVVQRFAENDGEQMNLDVNARMKIFIFAPLSALFLTSPVTCILSSIMNGIETLFVYSMLGFLIVLWATHWTVRLTLRALNERTDG